MKIAIDNIGVAYDGRRIIDGLSLTIEPGTFFTLLGPSGCGKTTLLRALAGFVPIVGGRLTFGAKDVTHQPAHTRNIGMVFQDYALFPDKTVFDNVAYGLRARRISEADIKRKVAEALERVDLGPFGGRHPAALSGGQRQRVALARAMVIAPDVLLMDEPLSNLDSKLRHQVRDTISHLQREAGITTVFVTHDQDEALAMSDQIGVMNAGRLEQVGTPGDVYRNPRTAYVADFVGAANVLDVRAGPADAPLTAVVELAGHHMQARSLGPVKTGLAKVAIRPEDVTLSRGIVVGQVQAHIDRRQYLGAKTSYRMTLIGGPSLRVDCSGDLHDAHALGDIVSLAFDPAKTLVLAS
jgi:iron(III) transport system ATP-binding protein